MFRQAQQSWLAQCRRSGSLLKRRTRAPRPHGPNQCIHIYIAKTLERRRDTFPNPPAVVRRAAAQWRKHLCFALGQEAAQADHAAKRKELVGRIGRGLVGVVGQVAFKECLIAFICVEYNAHDLCQFEVAAWAGQPRFLQQKRIPVFKFAQRVPIPVCFRQSLTIVLEN